jgi:hypothetical protein
VERDYDYNRHKEPSRAPRHRDKTTRRGRKRLRRLRTLGLLVSKRGNGFRYYMDNEAKIKEASLTESEPEPGYVFEPNSGVYAKKFVSYQEDWERAKALDHQVHSIQEEWSHDIGSFVTKVFRTTPKGEVSLIYTGASRKMTSWRDRKSSFQVNGRSRTHDFHSTWCRCIQCRPWMFDADGRQIYHYNAVATKLHDKVDRKKWPKTWATLIKFQFMNNALFTKYVSDDEIAERAWREKHPEWAPPRLEDKKEDKNGRH